MAEYMIYVKPIWIIRLWRFFFPKKEVWTECETLQEAIDAVPTLIERPTTVNMRGVFAIKGKGAEEGVCICDKKIIKTGSLTFDGGKYMAIIDGGE